MAHSIFEKNIALIHYSTGLQQEQPQLYESLAKILSPEEQAIVQQVVNKADAIQQNEAAAAAAAANGGAGQ